MMGAAVESENLKHDSFLLPKTGVAATKDENNAWIIGIVVAVLGLLLFTAVVFILHRKQRVPAESTESQVKSGVSEETVQLTTNTSSGSERNEEGPNV
ncbi:hypothetical protein BaRGS_00039688 [Batillaria attramentaria]|uniref:Uncharacterized protein n=1 Tax=Batillaria attramentaria TaxID=370345 RepID=A0ABD0J2J6_9CAEN